MRIPSSVKMIVSDFDGIFTDNCIYIDDNMKTSRKLNFKDIMGVSLLKKAGFELAIISGEKNSAINLLAKKFDLKEIHQGIRIKIEVLEHIMRKHNLEPSEILYIGDDVNDLDCLNLADTKITVPNAVSQILKVKNVQVTTKIGGEGAFREVVDCFLNL